VQLWLDAYVRARQSYVAAIADLWTEDSR